MVGHVGQQSADRFRRRHGRIDRHRSVQAQSVVRSATTARMDGDLTSASLITVESIGANSAFANSALVAVGLGAGADATPLATVETGP